MSGELLQFSFRDDSGRIHNVQATSEDAARAAAKVMTQRANAAHEERMQQIENEFNDAKEWSAGRIRGDSCPNCGTHHSGGCISKPTEAERLEMASLGALANDTSKSVNRNSNTQSVTTADEWRGPIGGLEIVVGIIIAAVVLVSCSVINNITGWIK